LTIFDKKATFFPFNRGKNHWVLIALFPGVPNRFVSYDPLGSAARNELTVRFFNIFFIKIANLYFI